MFEGEQLLFVMYHRRSCYLLDRSSLIFRCSMPDICEHTSSISKPPYFSITPELVPHAFSGLPSYIPSNISYMTMSPVPYLISNEAKASHFLFLPSFKSTVIISTVVVASALFPILIKRQFWDGYKRFRIVCSSVERTTLVAVRSSGDLTCLRWSDMLH